MATPKGCRWYFQRLWKALLLGTVLLVLFLLIFAVLLLQAYEFVVPLLPYEWLEGVLIAGGTVLFGLIGYLSAGPLALITMGVYLSQVGRWKELKEALPSEQIELPEFEDSSKLHQSILNAVGLSLFIFFCALLSLIPVLAFIAFFSGAFALGKDWCWTADEQFKKEHRKRSKFLYCVGMGIIPGLVATIPAVGVIGIPVLQLAGMLRYAERKKGLSQ